MSSICGLEDPLKEEMATHSSILVWEIPWTDENSDPSFIELHELFIYLFIFDSGTMPIGHLTVCNIVH